MMPRALLLTYYFPPDYLIPQTRAWKVADGLGRSGWEVDVVAPRIRAHLGHCADTGAQGAAQDWERLRGLPEGVRVHRASPDLVSWWTGRLTRPEHSRVPSALRRVLDAAQKQAAWPDAKLSWLPFGLARAWRLARTRRYDALITNSMPYTNHLAGLLLSRRFSLPWVVDMRDSWAVSGQEQFASLFPVGWHRRLHGRFMDRVMVRAGSAWSLCPGFTEAFRRRYAGRIDPEVFQTFPLGFDGPAPVRSTPRTDEFTVVYSGTIRGKIAPLTPVLDGVRRLRESRPETAKRLRVRVFTRQAYIDFWERQARKAGVDDLISFSPMLREADLMDALGSAHLLLALAGDAPWSRERYSGKLFTYLAAGRPILVVGPDEGLQARTVRETGTGTSVEADAQAVAQALAEAIAAWSEGREMGFFAPNDEALNALSFERGILPGMLRELERITGHGDTRP